MNYFKEFFNYITEFPTYLGRKKKRDQASEARNKADELHHLDGKRYFVIFWNGKYMVMNSNDRKAINSTMPKYNQLSFMQLMENKVYATK